MEETYLAAKRIDSRIEPGNMRHPAQSIQLVPGCNVVEASQDNIKRLQKSCADFGNYVRNKRSRVYRRIEFSNALRRYDSFEFAQIFFSEEDTSGQITEFNHIEVDEADLSDSKQRQVFKSFISQSTTPNDKDASFG